MPRWLRNARYELRDFVHHPARTAKRRSSPALGAGSIKPVQPASAATKTVAATSHLMPLAGSGPLHGEGETMARRLANGPTVEVDMASAGDRDATDGPAPGQEGGRQCNGELWPWSGSSAYSAPSPWACWTPRPFPAGRRRRQPGSRAGGICRAAGTAPSVTRARRARPAFLAGPRCAGTRTASQARTAGLTTPINTQHA